MFKRARQKQRRSSQNGVNLPSLRVNSMIAEKQDSRENEADPVPEKHTQESSF